jgi:hypothetical protein
MEHLSGKIFSVPSFKKKTQWSPFNLTDLFFQITLFFIKAFTKEIRIFVLKGTLSDT